MHSCAASVAVCAPHSPRAHAFHVAAGDRLRDRGPRVPSPAVPFTVHAEGSAIEDELMPWEARVVPRREKIAEWLAETGMDKFIDLVQILFRCAVVV